MFHWIRLLAVCLVVCVAFNNTAHAQKRQFSANGIPLIKNYPPKIIGGNAQVFSITQDNRGVIYLANKEGIIEYDGAEWRTLPAENGKEINSVYTGPDGKIYGAGGQTWGRLEPNELGQLQYNSLTHLLQSKKDVGQIKKLLFIEDKTYVQNESTIFILNGDSLVDKIETDHEISNIFYFRDRIYMIEEDIGLSIIKNNKIEPLENGYEFSTKNVVYMTRFSEKDLIVTKNSGIYEINEYDEIIHLPHLDDFTIETGFNIHNKFLSIGTLSDGIIVLDNDFNIVYEVGLEKGIVDASIKAQFIDKENNLWLATNKGVSRVEIITPIISFNKVLGIKTTVQAITRFYDKIYIAALDGLYYFDVDGTLSKVDEIKTQCYNLRVLPYKGDTLLFISETSLLYALDKEGHLMEVSEGGPYDVKLNPLDSNELIVLHYDGITNAKITNGVVSSDYYFRNICKSDNDVFNMVFTEDGTMYIGTTPNDGVYKTHVNIFKDTTIGFEHIDENDGLQIGFTYLFKHNSGLYVGGDSGLFKYEQGYFSPSNQFGIDFAKDDRSIHRINEDKEGNIWMILYDQNNNWSYGFASKQPDGSFEWNNSAFNRYAESVIHTIFHDDNGITWLGGVDGVLRFDATVQNVYDVEYKALIRSVRFGSDLLYGGAGSPSEIPQLDYSSTQSISFKFTATSYFDEESLVYSYMLEGYDDSWSEWSAKHDKEYNLQPGTYTFKVKARNIYGYESTVAEYTFVIVPPWYRTTWAYVMYAVGLVLLIYLLIRFSIRRVKKQNQRLEEIVEERTVEIVAQKEEVEKQKELVEEKNKDIMDSIRYAKHIQDAILPSDEFIKQCFNDAFVLYKPKDIVSGDFYWLKRKGNKTLYAAVDCTGHGVPGAFVSIVGNNGLNRAINEFDLIEPGLILDKLTELVEEAFKQQGSDNTDDVKDGMDIALCVVDHDTNTLHFSGANNPLWIVRNKVLNQEEVSSEFETKSKVEIHGDLSFIEVKADKQPIGHYDGRKPFSTNTFKLEKGDRIYTFSDGFADQFGGPKGKKFKYKTFKELLIKHNTTPLASFEQILNDEFESWRGDLEQIDDVCVIGIEI